MTFFRWPLYHSIHSCSHNGKHVVTVGNISLAVPWIPSKIHCFINIGSIYIACDILPKVLMIRQVRCKKHLTVVEIWTPTCPLSGTAYWPSSRIMMSGVTAYTPQIDMQVLRMFPGRLISWPACCHPFAWPCTTRLFSARLLQKQGVCMSFQYWWLNRKVRGVFKKSLKKCCNVLTSLPLWLQNNMVVTFQQEWLTYIFMDMEYIY